mmetsp:Transcript_44673/g.107722  ORF Transcript_44673/g.107722 Transcript_44673/m.107722 type:complete len:120 (-) Transcript_44673:189-548(-)
MLDSFFERDWGENNKTSYTNVTGNYEKKGNETLFVPCDRTITASRIMTLHVWFAVDTQQNNKLSLDDFKSKTAYIYGKRKSLRLIYLLPFHMLQKQQKQAATSYYYYYLPSGFVQTCYR